MQFRRRLLSVGLTLFIAAATGHIMQYGGEITEKLRATATAFHETPVATDESSALVETEAGKIRAVVMMADTGKSADLTAHAISGVMTVSASEPVDKGTATVLAQQ